MKIGIIAAQAEEASPILQQLDTQEEYISGNQHFYLGNLHSHEIILLKCGIGKVHATIGTTLMINNHRPDYIINIGSAGGFARDLSIGDIIVSTEIRYHDVDLTPFGYEYGQAAKMPAYFEADKKLLEVASECFAKLSGGKKLHQGLIVSGDSFLANPDQLKFADEAFNKIYAAEMEGCAIAHVCHIFKVPFLIIRAISDIIHADNNKETYEKALNTASINSAELVTQIIKAV